MITQDDPRYDTYQGLVQGTLAPIVKSMGESGNLATEDIARAQKLMAELFPFPDSEEAAREKLEALRNIIAKGQRNQTMNERAAAMGLEPVPE